MRDDLAEWVLASGLPAGECALKLSTGEQGGVYAVLDLAWPQGLQEGFGQPVALLEPEELLAAANDAGYRYFTDVDAFKEYVTREVLWRRRRRVRIVAIDSDRRLLTNAQTKGAQPRDRRVHHSPYSTASAGNIL